MRGRGRAWRKGRAPTIGGDECRSSAGHPETPKHDAYILHDAWRVLRIRRGPRRIFANVL